MRLLTAISVEYEADTEIDSANDVCTRLTDDIRNLMKRCAPRGSTTDTYITCGRAYSFNSPQDAEDMVRAINSNLSLKTGNKTLIACMSCHQVDYKFQDGLTTLSPQSRPITGRRAAVRDTWWKDIPASVDKRFFFGHGAQRTPQPDEIFLDAPDNYENLAYKVRAMCKWAFDNDYEYIFKCDDDTYVYVDRLLNSDYKSWPYIGQDIGGYASGLGYWLNKTAMQLVASMPLAPTEYAEDKKVGVTLSNSGILIHDDPRYFHDQKKPIIDPTTFDTSNRIAINCCPPEVMKALWSQ